jgi:hypothetical protein
MTRRFRAALAALPLISLTVFFGSLTLLVVGCASGPRVIESSDGASRPGWATVMKPVFEDDGKRYFVGHVEVDGDASRSSALNMADEKALSEPMRSLADQFLDQNQVGEELRRDGAVGQRVISATRSFRMPMPGLQIVKRYWETVQVDEFTTATRAFALAEVSTAEYEKAKRDYFARLRGDSEVAKILREVGQAQRDAVLQAAKEKR